ncbi:MAG: helicase-related protein [Crenarchaeota archaeon]|nr:helicase-related protein [Thermoproteota archaeon]MCR8471529.1 helicase-related protein [Thermoproteota archaeon]MCR8488706.1 helicase-related protein [Thermoproteota archaeon]
MDDPISELRRLADRLQNLLKSKNIEPRAYQFWIVNAICKAKIEGKNVILELDAGMGKRIIMYMITQLFDNERILIISPSRASIWDMAIKFRELSGSDEWFGVLTGGTPKWLKRGLLLNRRVILATPISLAGALRHQEVVPKFDIIIINEADKVIRRVARTKCTGVSFTHKIRFFEDLIGEKNKFEEAPDVSLAYPWNILKRILPKDACWIGMSGTLRDEHYTIDSEGRVVVRKEIDTLANELLPSKELVILTMDSLLERTDLGEYIIRNLTIIRPVGVEDPNVEIISSEISAEIERVVDKILERNRELYPAEETQFRTREKVMDTIATLPNTDPLKVKFLKLALARRHLFAGTPSSYFKFLARPMIKKLIKEHRQVDLEDILPRESKKMQAIIEIMRSWWEHRESSIVILASFVRTALDIIKRLRNEGVNNVLLLTGKVKNKKLVLEKFKSMKQSVLVLTPVAERDLDLPEAGLVIVHDVVSTAKSMYQRIKRSRRGLVIILYYKNTHEEKKVKVLLTRIIKRYPWSVRILSR